MPDPQSFEEAVLDGFALVAAANPAAQVRLVYDKTGKVAYGPDQVGIHLDTYPEGARGSVSITDYTVSDDPSLSDSVMGVQVTIKHQDRQVVRRISGDLFSLFHARQRGMLGTVTLVSARRASGTNTGQDSSGRLGRIENYYLTLHRPSANRS